MTTPMDFMVITAHPDDAEFGAAGTVARWILEGKTGVYVIATNGDKGTSDRTISSEDLIPIRQQEQRNACKVLGVDEVVFLGYQDQTLEDTPEFRKHIVKMIRTYRPDAIITLDPYRRYLWHRDHRIVGQVVMDAVFPFARDHMAYPDMLERGLEPHKVAQLFFFGTEDINYHSDVTTTFDQKLAALCCHESQMRELGVDNLESWLRNRCRRMAEGSDYVLAEGFHRIKLPG